MRFHLDTAQLSALGGLILLLVVDLAFGVAVSLKRHTFDFRTLPQTIENNVAPYLIPLMLLAGGAAVGKGTTYQGADVGALLSGLFYGGSALYTPKLLVDIKDKMTEVFGSVPIPAPTPTVTPQHPVVPPVAPVAPPVVSSKVFTGTTGEIKS